jgi:hypothetical protein
MNQFGCRDDVWIALFDTGRAILEPEDHPRLIYGGNWSLSSNAATSGSTALPEPGAGLNATLNFTGSGVQDLSVRSLLVSVPQKAPSNHRGHLC